MQVIFFLRPMRRIALMSSVKKVCNTLILHRQVLLLIISGGGYQIVFDEDGYAECPDCDIILPFWDLCLIT
jgi:hypothetical protein